MAKKKKQNKKLTKKELEKAKGGRLVSDFNLPPGSGPQLPTGF